MWSRLGRVHAIKHNALRASSPPPHLKVRLWPSSTKMTTRSPTEPGDTWDAIRLALRTCHVSIIYKTQKRHQFMRLGRPFLVRSRKFAEDLRDNPLLRKTQYSIQWDWLPLHLRLSLAARFGRLWRTLIRVDDACKITEWNNTTYWVVDRIHSAKTDILGQNWFFMGRTSCVVTLCAFRWLA